ncbi:MAG: FKBP-type peptidyl-prolyl cis-trans isomerase [Pedobacter sp.]|nr:MAG: FKBP-type peptidyl-prolyl cis-trans isomerase [Pedobacter sp.]
MKKMIFTLLLPFCATAGFAQTPKKVTPAKKTSTVKTVAKPANQPLALKTTMDSASYSFGVGMAKNMKEGGLTELNYALLVQGLKDVFNSKTLLVTEEKSRTAINNLIGSVTKKKYASNIAEGSAFLENNKKQQGIMVTASGIQYQVLTRGTGISPKATDTVLVHYKGSLLNGKEFDSSYSRNEPISFPLNGVIPGWTEGVQLMQAGSKYKFFIPYQLAYGENGAGQDIPPYSTLIFEIELLKINGK